MTRDTYLVNSGWGYEEAAVEKLSCTSGSHPEQVTRKLEMARPPQVCFVDGSLNSTSGRFYTFPFQCGTVSKEQHFLLGLGTAKERWGRMRPHHPGFSCFPGNLVVCTLQGFSHRWCHKCRGPVPSGYPKLSSSKGQLDTSVLINS